jgi:glycosyltransferase involved in cell wall biosynthesis
MTNISVVIPVGPNPIYLDWLPDCIMSVLQQTHKPLEIIIIDDGASLTLDSIIGLFYAVVPIHALERFNDKFTVCLENDNKTILVRVYSPPWNVGVADAFNFGIALADSELVFMLGSDDKMMPTCLEEVVKEYEKQKVKGWYNVTIITSGGEVMTLPNNTAAVHKDLWQWTGGFPPSAGVGAPDALLLSILLRHAPYKILQVKEGTPLCWLREHEHQDTRRNAGFFHGEVISIRDKETTRFKPKTR